MKKIYFFFLLISVLGFRPDHPSAKIIPYFTPAATPITDISQTTLPDRSPISAYEAVGQALAGAKKNIYLVAYEFNIYHLSRILLSKLGEGVKVFILVEADSLKLPETHFLLDTLHKAGATVIPDQKKGGIMHNKFAVIDEKILITGSANYSINAFFQQFNDVVVIEHPGLAQQYLQRFMELAEKMYRKRPTRPSLNPKVFPDLEDENTLYQAVFSRSVFDPTTIMVQTINTCKKSIHFLIFAFSSKPITEAMKSCLKKGTVKGIFDNAFESENITKNWATIPFQILWDAGAEVKYDNVIEKIHHKNIVIDDHTVITGSFNFSANAQKNNDENYLIIRSQELATRYRDRFQELWKEFPSETLFEKYIRARNRKQTTLSFKDYEKKAFSSRASAVNKELRGGEFKGRVVLVEDGNTVVVRLAQSGERVTVTLAGIIAPIGGFGGFHGQSQEPQAHIAKEGLIFLAAQRMVTGKVVAGEGFNIHALLFDESDESRRSLNGAMLEAGLVYPLWVRSQNPIEKTDPPPLTYQKHPTWVTEFTHLNEALEKARNKKRMLWGELALKVSPLEFITLLEEAELQRKLTENQYALGKYEQRAWIGNRKTGKAYPPGSPTYMEYLRDLNDKKLIFFKSGGDAEAAGYVLRNEKNY